MSIFFIFFIGLFVGSFLNVLADRLPVGKSILGRSHCDYCKHTLSFIDLIPLVSFSVQKGKCRYCKKKLSFNYPLLELVTAFSFVLAYLLVIANSIIVISSFDLSIYSSILNQTTLFPFTPLMILQYIFAFSITSVLIVVFFADLRFGIIPDQVTAIGVAIALIGIVFFNRADLASHLLAGAGAMAFFYALYWSSVKFLGKEGMGLGDVKFALFMGLLLGAAGVIIALYIAFLTGGLVGIILILWKKKQMKSSISFGPFLVFGTAISFFLSSLLIPQIMVLL